MAASQPAYLTETPFPLENLAEFPKQLPLPEGDAANQIYTASVCLLVHYFGLDWCQQWVMGPQGEKGDFLKNDRMTDQRADTSIIRIYELAEKLINLQSTPGFWGVIRRMVNVGVEVGFSELEPAEALVRRGIDCRFREPTGVKGADYDLDIYLDGWHLCGETKCKIESRDPSLRSYLSSLNEARRRNLPADKPGAIFIKIPELWVLNGAVKALPSATEAFLAKSRRLVAIVVSMKPIEFSDRLVNSYIESRVLLNHRSPYFDERATKLVTAPVAPLAWTSLLDVWGPNLPAFNADLHTQFSREFRLHP